MIKRAVRNLIRENFPYLNTLLHARGLRKHFRQEFGSRQKIFKTKIYGDGLPRVLAGPFKGMVYLDEIVWGPIEPKWLGSYEQILHRIVYGIFEQNYRSIIDVGSAEGYYSVGLALKFPNILIHSFDVDPWGRRQQRRLAKLNTVSNIKFEKFCNHEKIDKIARERTLLICDIEGSEYGLLDLSKSESLRNCDIIAEMHPHRDKEKTAATGAERMAAAFGETHIVETIFMQDGLEPLAELGAGLFNLSPEELRICVDERRDFEQCWLWMKAKKYSN